MQHPNWNDLRVLLALHRHRFIAAAARALHIDSTTVSRRIKALERAIGTELAERLGDGSFQLTEAGKTAVAGAEAIERDLGSLQSQASGAATQINGSVRLSAVPMIINRVIIPAALAFVSQHNALELQLNPDIRNLSLNRRETDMAIRLARPRGADSRVKTRRIGVLKHAIYVSAESRTPSLETLPWVRYTDTFDFLPQDIWMKQQAASSGQQISRLRVGDAEGALLAVATGAGKTVLPQIIGDKDKRLYRVRDADVQPDIEREVWLLVRAELADLARCRAVGDWLAGLF